MTDQEAKDNYYASQGLNTVDVGSVDQLRKSVNAKLKARGHKPIILSEKFSLVKSLKTSIDTPHTTP